MDERTFNAAPSLTDGPPRRRFFGRLAGAATLGLAGLVPSLVRADSSAAKDDGPQWPGKLKEDYRQVVDAYAVNGGSPLDFAYTFLATNSSGAAVSVVVLRAGALPIALNSTMWEKYKIGESFKINDPETKAPAVKNPFLHPKPGIMKADDAAIDRLLANGAVFGACNVALHGQSKALAGNAGVSAEDAAKEWIANVVPGVVIIPSGVWGLNRAQAAGCTYCSGG
jgi:hypothetical protein